MQGNTSNIPPTRAATTLRVAAVALLALTLALAPADRGIPDFSNGTGWLNSSGLTPRDLQGKVVLVDFWEYTCVNCLRTLPYLRAWYDRYHHDGFEIVGVHTPEFGFSGDRGNVEAATRRLKIDWPVVLDSDREIWTRYENHSWPNEYLFDQSGRLVDRISGEGGYEATESKIQSLLKAGDAKLTLPPVMALLPQDNYTKPGAVCYLHTPEVLVSHAKIANASAAVNHGRDSTYVDDGAKRTDGAIYLQGSWHLTGDAAISAGGAAYLAMRYHAIQVVAVLSPSKGTSERIDVTQDGEPLAKADAGDDIAYDSSGMSYVTVDAPRAYDVVTNAKMAFHEIRFAPQQPGAVDVYSFAFESCEATT
jgi:thiol-disulfide isomerase/thioredoxin